MGRKCFSSDWKIEICQNSNWKIEISVPTESRTEICQTESRTELQLSKIISFVLRDQKKFDSLFLSFGEKLQENWNSDFQKLLYNAQVHYFRIFTVKMVISFVCPTKSLWNSEGKKKTDARACIDELDCLYASIDKIN